MQKKKQIERISCISKVGVDKNVFLREIYSDKPSVYECVNLWATDSLVKWRATVTSKYNIRQFAYLHH